MIGSNKIHLARSLGTKVETINNYLVGEQTGKLIDFLKLKTWPTSGEERKEKEDKKVERDRTTWREMGERRD